MIRNARRLGQIPAIVGPTAVCPNGSYFVNTSGGWTGNCVDQNTQAIVATLDNTPTAPPQQATAAQVTAANAAALAADAAATALTPTIPVSVISTAPAAATIESTLSTIPTWGWIAGGGLALVLLFGMGGKK